MGWASGWMLEMLRGTKLQKMKEASSYVARAEKRVRTHRLISSEGEITDSTNVTKKRLADEG